MPAKWWRHTLMQTIARANRVAKDKKAGEIIDYIGVFRDLQAALAVYGSDSGGGMSEGDLPVEAKSAQAGDLRELLSSLSRFTVEFGVDLAAGLGVSGFDWVAWLAAAAEVVLASHDRRREFLVRANDVGAQWKAVKPHPAATEAQPLMSVIVCLAQRVRMEMGTPDISGVLASVEELLEESVGATPFVIDPDAVVKVDLSQVDFDALASLFAQGQKHTAAARLQSSLEKRLERMIRANPMRINYARHPPQGVVLADRSPSAGEASRHRPPSSSPRASPYPCLRVDDGGSGDADNPAAAWPHLARYHRPVLEPHRSQAGHRSDEKTGLVVSSVIPDECEQRRRAFLSR